MAEPHALIVWGAGGHGRVVADAARAAGWHVLGFADRDEALVGQARAGEPPVLLSEAQLQADLARGSGLPDGLRAIALGVGGNEARRRGLAWIPERYLEPVIHPRAVVSPTASIGRGTVILGGAVVNPGARIGAGVIVNTAAVIEHDVEIEDAAHVSPGAILTGGVRVGAGAWIGAGAIVIPGRRVGRGCIVGAGAVVLRDVPDAFTVVGNPARPLSDGAT